MASLREAWQGRGGKDRVRAGRGPLERRGEERREGNGEEKGAWSRREREDWRAGEEGAATCHGWDALLCVLPRTV